MQAPRVIIVLLRQPSNAIGERRDDPFWEVGSFSCTGCHSRNLLSPKRASELSGARLAFVQGGSLGFKLVHVTPEIWIEPTGGGFEARWSPARMPLSYQLAPLVIDNHGNSDVPLLARESRGVFRQTPVSRFASAFRSRRLPVAGDIGAAIIACYRRHRTSDRVAKTYTEAMPHPPSIIEANREERYQAIRKFRRSSAQSLGLVGRRGTRCASKTLPA